MEGISTATGEPPGGLRREAQQSEASPVRGASASAGLINRRINSIPGAGLPPKPSTDNPSPRRGTGFNKGSQEPPPPRRTRAPEAPVLFSAGGFHVGQNFEGPGRSGEGQAQGGPSGCTPTTRTRRASWGAGVQNPHLRPSGHTWIPPVTLPLATERRSVFGGNTAPPGPKTPDPRPPPPFCGGEFPGVRAGAGAKEGAMSGELHGTFFF